MKFTAITAIAAATVITLTGCTQMYEWFGTNKQEVHEYAVDKTFVMLDKAIAKKLDEMRAAELITQPEYEALIKRAAQGEEYIRKLIDDIYAKYQLKKAKKEEVKKDEAKKEEATTEVQKVDPGEVEQAAAAMKKGKKVSAISKPKVEASAKVQKK